MALIDAPCKIGSDANEALINMWTALGAGWRPPEQVSEADYRRVKDAADYSNPLTAFVGFGCSFAGKWFGGYARGGTDDRNYAANAASSLRKKLRGMLGVGWRCGDYRALSYSTDSVIYCDPPYQGATQYGGAPDPFDWHSFWQFCRDKANAGHAVFVSEYQAPPDFHAILEINTKLSIRAADGSQPPRIERLFVPVGTTYWHPDMSAFW